MECLLDYKTAINFLNKIEITDAEDIMKNNPLTFLQLLTTQYQEHIPFQCVSILAQTKEEKHVPTIVEVVEASLSLEGGVCFTLNTFFCILLRTLGFKADVLDGCYSVCGDNHNHVIVLVSDLRYTDDNYIIDVGCGFPFEAPLAVSELPATRYFAGLEYRYELNEHNILRLHRAGDDIPTGEKPLYRKDWRQVFHFNLKPVTFEFYRPYMEEIYTDEEKCDYHFELRAIRFIPPEKAGNTKERIMVAFKNMSLLVGPMDNAKKTKLSTDEWAQQVKEHFPNIPPHKVDLAIAKLIEIFKRKEQQTQTSS